MATKEDIIKRKLITFTLKRAAGRENPWEMGVDTDYVMEIGEKQGWRCAITGDKLSFKRGVGKKNPMVLSVDRINSKKGYIPGNVQLTTWKANQFKRNYSKTTLLNMCEKILKQGGRI